MEKMDFLKIFAERLKERRKELKLTCEELGEKIGGSRTTIYRYEKSINKELTLGTISMIAEHLGVNPDWLIGKSDIKYPEDDEKPVALTLTELYNSIKYQLLYEGLVVHQDVPLTEDEVNVILQALRVGIKMVEEDRTSLDN